MRRGLGLIVIDYLQLMQGRRRVENRQQEISEISRSLKIMAKELEVPVIALSQLSRAPELRTSNHRPILSDLRESGAMEQDADLVMFLYRDDYYIEDSEKKNISEVIIAKHRNGSIGTVDLAWIPSIQNLETLKRNLNKMIVKLVEKVGMWADKNNVLHSGTKVVAGVSGPDSVCLCMY